MSYNVYYNGSQITTISENQLKTLNCSGKYMSSNIIVIDPSSLKRVGGRIFYDNGSNNATYTFYDSSMNVLSTQTVAGLESAYYYTVSGTPTNDRWYVYDNTTHTERTTYHTFSAYEGLVQYTTWGYEEVEVHANADEIGSGKTNTNLILSISDTSTTGRSSIFKYIQACRDINLNGNNDWYLPSKAEQEELRLAKNSLNKPLVDWYGTQYTIWTSVERDKWTIWYWDPDKTSSSPGWSANLGKADQGTCGLAARSF